MILKKLQYLIQNLIHNHPYSINTITIMISIFSTYYFILGNPLNPENTKVVLSLKAPSKFTICDQYSNFIDGSTSYTCDMTINTITWPTPQIPVVSSVKTSINGHCPPSPTCTITHKY